MADVGTEELIHGRIARVVRTARGSAWMLGACAAIAVLAAALAEPAAAGHGAPSYEGPKKIAEEKKREKEAAAGQGAAAPAASGKSAETPVAVAPAAMSAGERDYAFATTLRRRLRDLVAIVEDQIASGTDAQLRALAKRSLEAHRKDIAELDQWISEHPQPVK